MWGDSERAATLDGNDPLASLLYQVASPAHLPWNDTRWNELLHGYDVWVHVDEDSDNEIISAACQSMAKHATTSSNLATLSLHVTRMLRDLSHDLEKMTAAAAAAASSITSTTDDDSRPTSQLQQPDIADFSTRISVVAKARATAGALRLLRLLCHPVIVQACQDPATSSSTLREAFTYHTRGDLPSDQPAGYPLMHSLLDLIVVTGNDKSSALATAEVYDVTVFAFQLLLVLCSTQLYQPFRSSFDQNRPDHYILDELFLHDSDDERISSGGDRTTGYDDDNTNVNNQSYNLHLLWSSERSVVSHASNSSSRKNNKTHKGPTRSTAKKRIWTPRSIMKRCLQWQINRPPAPQRSLAYMYFILVQNAVTLSSSPGASGGGEKLGPDGMYESYMVVQATAPDEVDTSQQNGVEGSARVQKGGAGNLAFSQSPPAPRHPSTGSLILDATKGVLTISGTLFLLPFRLMSLVIGVLKHSTGAGKTGTQISQDEKMKKFSSASKSSRTRDVLWLTDSILADLSCCLFLLLSNNNRNYNELSTEAGDNRRKGKNKSTKRENPFRADLYGLTDNRWEGEATSDLPDLPNFYVDNHASFAMPDLGAAELQQPSILEARSSIVTDTLSFNFDLLFNAFGRTLHTELGALSMYTLLQSSPAFAESLAVRSDIDSLVLPLLRTLYISSRTNTYMARDYASKGSSKDSSCIDIRSLPFRSQSQLYVIIILLLILSQERSFGRDVFQRTIVPNVLWYKERNLKNINLGSVILLTLLRLLLFNLNRMKDGFLLSNCCAVLVNLSHAISDLHDFASMRLASVTVTIMKKHAKLAAATGTEKQRSKGDNVNDEPIDESVLGMHADTAHALLELIKDGVGASTIEGNIHLVYALVYHQMDLIKLCRNTALYKSKDTERIQAVTLKASSLIQKDGARSAPKALKVLEDNVEELKAASRTADESTKSPSKRNKRNSALTTEDDFLPFTYQEEADPEIFFLPYVWDMIVSVVTASTMEWRKNEIKAFALLDEVDGVEVDIQNEGQSSKVAPEKFSEEVDGVV